MAMDQDPKGDGRDPRVGDLLEDALEGDDGAREALLSRVYDELRGLAERYMRDERVGHTLQPTALVNEAFLRLVDRSDAWSGGKRQFLSLAAQAMRRVVVDHARAKGRLRRGGAGWHRVTLGGLEEGTTGDELDLVELDDLLERLAVRDERAAKVVELRYFSGLSIDETAAVLGVSSGTVDNDWYVARAWLMREMRRGEDA